MYISGKLGSSGRRGMVLVLAALMLVGLCGFVAMAVDIGVLAVFQTQLQTAVDAAASAGAMQLATDRRISTTITNITPESTAAIAEAKVVAKLYTINRSQLVLGNTAVVIGYRDMSPVNSSAALITSNSLIDNSVQVTANLTVPTFFAGVFSSSGRTVSATSTATVELDQVSGFTPSPSGLGANILPIAMDQTAYNLMASGTGGDSYTFTPSGYVAGTSTGVTSGADGVVESVLYPVASGDAGNWGTINFGVSNNSTSILSSQISSGITPAQMIAEFPPNGLVTAPHTFSANPGISAGIKSALTSIIGKAVWIPIYDTTGGNGNNAWFHVIQYASVRIVAVNMTGSDKYVIVQPAISNDQTAIPNTSSGNSWSQGGIVYIHLSQ